MKKNRKLLCIFSTTILGFLLTSCNSKSQGKTSNNIDHNNNNEEIVKDKVQFLNSYLDTEPATLDSSKSTDTYGSAIIKNITESLTRLEENDDGETIIVPAGAERWEASDDGMVYTFYLRDNFWSDGSPINAEHYAYGIKRTADPATGNPNGQMFAELFKNGAEVFSGKLSVDKLGVEVIDNKTLKITLSKPITYFLDYTYSPQFVPQKEDLVKKFGDAYGAEFNTNIYSGPFMIENWVHNSNIVLVKNPYYWDKDNVILEKIDFKIINDNGARHNSMANGSIDHLDVTMSNWKKRFSMDPNMNLVEYSKPHVSYVFFNTKDSFFKNVNIRKAFVVSMDRKEIAEAVWDNLVLPGKGWISPAISIGGKKYRELVGSPIENLIKDNPDPKKLLLKGMEELGLGQDPSTITVKLSIGGTDQQFRTLAEYLQQTWVKKLGIKVLPEFNEWPIFLSNIYDGNFQIGHMGSVETINDPAGSMESHLSSSDSVKNFWKSKEFDDLYWKAAVESDLEKRIEIYKKLEEILICNEAVVNPISHQLVESYRYNYVYNLPKSPFSTSGFKYVYTSGR